MQKVRCEGSKAKEKTSVMMIYGVRIHYYKSVGEFFWKDYREN